MLFHVFGAFPQESYLVLVQIRRWFGLSECWFGLSMDVIGSLLLNLFFYLRYLCFFQHIYLFHFDHLVVAEEEVIVVLIDNLLLESHNFFIQFIEQQSGILHDCPIVSGLKR